MLENVRRPSRLPRTTDELADLMKANAIRERAALANETLLTLGSEERRRGVEGHAERVLPGPEFAGQHPRLSIGGGQSEAAVPGTVDARRRLAIPAAGAESGRLRSSEPELDVSRARTHGAAGNASEDGHHRLSVERALGGSEGLSGDGAGSPSVGEGIGRLRPLWDESEMDAAGGFVLGLILGGISWLSIIAAAAWVWRATQ